MLHVLNVNVLGDRSMSKAIAISAKSKASVEGARSLFQVSLWNFPSANPKDSTGIKLRGENGLRLGNL